MECCSVASLEAQCALSDLTGMHTLPPTGIVYGALSDGPPAGIHTLSPTGIVYGAFQAGEFAVARGAQRVHPPPGVCDGLQRL